jgi:hypothetical protein
VVLRLEFASVVSPNRAWHSDTFVSGPSWGVFAKEMSIAVVKEVLSWPDQRFGPVAR